MIETTMRRDWQCRWTEGPCTNPRVTMLSGHVHDLCEEHRLYKTSSARRLSESEPVVETSSSDDWEYLPMHGADWKLTRHDLTGDQGCQERGAALSDGVVFSSLFFHADVEALHACR